ncbi:VWA domain-containing protein [Lacipirellula limnantheis]|uniref:von Willebrand factor type A domain protein n=1 Tax=Lacipirellula limnantheis TaxID=2528024 RepID=A0A517TUZ3_9BACT|nr:VWA domain-containing protein [Lacipirellula limnantheis]QDT72177.1 von Willebrand factor type A domain protein [Lacipirellula limnantheis]
MRTFRWTWTANLGLAAALALVATTHAAESARLTAFRQGDETSYAVSLAPEMASKEVDSVDVVVLFDTSASQQGAYRETALEALKSLAADLRPNDRLQIVAVDLDARDVTDEFVAGSDAAVAKAIATLGDQAPLGSTDLAAGLNAAINKFDAAKSANRAILYIGDGASMANLLDAPTMGPLVEKLRAARAPLSSYAIGPQVDAELLAVLANQTGGNLYVAEPLVWQDEPAGVDDARAREENARHAQAVGKNLASWSRGAVAWPTKAQLPSTLGQAYPTAFPPLRADRDTVIVGRTPAEISQPVEVQVTAVGNDGKAVNFAWKVEPTPASNDNAYLAAIVDGASRNGGLSLPTLGTAGLMEIARLMGAQSDDLTVLAQQAVATGDREGALQIIDAVLRRDPGNVQARTVQTAIQKAPTGGESIPAGAATATPAPAANAPVGGDIILNKAVAADPIPPAEPGLLERRGPDGTFLDEVEQERRAFSQMLEAEVANTVIDARERMAAEPQIAIQELKLSLENIRRAAELDPATRAALEDKLSIALREATRKASLKDELDRLQEEELAAARDQKFLDAQLTRRIEREKQLMDRFNALMDERRYVEAEEVAAIVEEIDPNGVTPRVAALWARHKRHDYLQQVTRSARHNAAWDAMFQIELSHIPFPDNPPIVYPDAPVWEELTKRRKDRYNVDLKSEGEAERRIYGALRQPLRAPLEFVATPLNQVTQVLSEDYSIPIVIDTAALDAVASSPEVEINFSIGNVTLKSALELMLKSAGEGDLTYIVDNEVLLITTQEEAEKRLQVRVYPVADLVLPIINLGGMGGGGGMMGGGMGGGGGGMGGGGMGGGGMGGMGGGGMGGGGMGGGGGGGGGFFAVPDDVSVKPATVGETSKSAPPSSASVPATSSAATLAAPKVPGIEIDPSAAPEVFWSKYFSEQQQDEAVVRRAVKLLIKQQHYDHAIALIQAALAHGQPQPWMYESLGIALELDGRPKAEIERAIMSACDFSTNPQELMLIARYLSHIGLDRRAVEVYRQVAKVAPLEQDAYALGLRAAQRAKDADGIRWAAVGIIKQAWPTEQQELRNSAMRIAQATLAELEAAGDKAAVDQFRRELDEALVRDCVVKISWSGDADVDLVVEEPSGAVCSLREPRSAGGGVVLGDSYADFEKNDKAGSFSETYVCPQGFAGEYRVRIRKVWGDVVADRVTVDVYKNYRTKNEQHQRQHVAVNSDDDAMVVFDLEQGRRNDPVEAQQLVASVDRQQAISQAVLAQQLGSIASPSLQQPGRFSENDPFGLRRQLAFARGGAVGYQPVIISLPEGTSMISTAVVSADRRYVRISAAPQFSGIGNVTTFTFAGSSEQTDDNTDNGDNTDTADGGGGGGGGGGGVFDDFIDFVDF